MCAPNPVPFVSCPPLLVDSQNRRLTNKGVMVRTKTTPTKTSLFTCVICTEEKLALFAATLECHPHEVCKMCLRTWFNQSHSCPVCRAEVTSHDCVSKPREDYERAKRRQERRRQRLLRTQAEYDARVARDLLVRDFLDARQALTDAVHYVESIPGPPVDLTSDVVVSFQFFLD